MAGVITTGNHPKALWPGMHAFFGASYKEHPEEYKEIFSVEKSSKNYEEDTALTGFGLAPAKGEGQAVSYDSESQGFTKRYTHVVYGLGYVVTKEEIEDGQYEKFPSAHQASCILDAADQGNRFGQRAEPRYHVGLYRRRRRCSALDGAHLDQRFLVEQAVDGGRSLGSLA
jgi:hypothetical protein